MESMFKEPNESKIKTDGKHILIVDDDVNMLRSMEFILEAAGFEVSTGKDGKEGLEKILAARPSGQRIDLLISDIQMPGLSGLQLIDELRRRSIRMPVLVVTAYGDSELRREVMKRGGALLSKPFNDENFVQIVFWILEKNGNGSDPPRTKNEGESDRTPKEEIS